MKQIVGICGATEIIWNELAENKWMETIFHRLIDEDGEADWIISSVTKYLKTADVEAFVDLGNEHGWAFVCV